MFKCNCDTIKFAGVHAAECGANSEQLHNRFMEYAKGLEQAELVEMLREWIFFAELPEHCMSQSLKRVELAKEAPANKCSPWCGFSI